MFFWPCIMNWLYIKLPTSCTDYYLFIKYYSPLHVSSTKCSSSGGYSCIHAAYGTVTLYESSWLPVGTQLEWELTVGGKVIGRASYVSWVSVIKHQKLRIFASYFRSSHITFSSVYHPVTHSEGNACTWLIGPIIYSNNSVIIGGRKQFVNILYLYQLLYIFGSSAAASWFNFRLIRSYRV